MCRCQKTLPTGWTGFPGSMKPTPHPLSYGRTTEMWLPDKYVADVREHARVFYLPWNVCRYWNASRKKGEPLVFSGWYWAALGLEAGPFKAQSACYRDAWYRLVQHVTPPGVADRPQPSGDVDRAIARVKRKRERA